jgi:flagellar hook-length control protein FliK
LPRAILQPRGKSAASGIFTPSQPTASSGQAQSGATPSSGSSQPAQPAASAQIDPTLPVQRDIQAVAPQLQPVMVQTAAAAEAAQAAQHAAAEAEIAQQAEAEFQLTQSQDARAAADRGTTTLPRFTPHSAQQLAGQISRHHANGNRVFEIRLDPAELGKVDVRLEMRADNRVHAVLMAERPETLAELQRSARDLERALNEAGLDLSEDGISFQMQDDGQSPEFDHEDGPAAMPVFFESDAAGPTGALASNLAPQSTYGFLLSRREGVDLRI